jgi:hypothetical protein
MLRCANDLILRAARVGLDRLHSQIRDVAQPGSALDWGSRGRGFESRHPDHISSPAIAESLRNKHFADSLTPVVQLFQVIDVRVTGIACCSRCRAELCCNDTTRKPVAASCARLKRHETTKNDRRTPTVMPAIRLNANDFPRDSGGTALRSWNISDTNAAQISTRHAYARMVMRCTPRSFEFAGRLLYRSVWPHIPHSGDL